MANKSSNEMLGLQAMIVLAITMFFLIKCAHFKLLSFPVIFSVLVWIFHFGFFPVYYFGAQNTIFVDDLLKYSYEYILEAFNVCLLFYCFLNIGLVAGYKEVAPIDKETKPIEFKSWFVNLFFCYFCYLCNSIFVLYHSPIFINRIYGC